MVSPRMMAFPFDVIGSRVPFGFLARGAGRQAGRALSHGRALSLLRVRLRNAAEMLYEPSKQMIRTLRERCRFCAEPCEQHTASSGG